MMGFVPMEDYEGIGFGDLGRKWFKLGESEGLYIMAEVTPNVCRVIRIQAVDLKARALQSL